jgi:hypothetical protein
MAYRKTFPGKVRGTADPSASLGMTNKEKVVVRRGRLLKERVVAQGEGGCSRRGRLLKERVVAQGEGGC